MEALAENEDSSRLAKAEDENEKLETELGELKKENKDLGEEISILESNKSRHLPFVGRKKEK